MLILHFMNFKSHHKSRSSTIAIQNLNISTVQGEKKFCMKNLPMVLHSVLIELNVNKKKKKSADCMQATPGFSVKGDHVMKE